MANRNILRLTASSLIVGAVLVSCSQGQSAPKYASQSQTKMSNGKGGVATLNNAENAVLADPGNVELRKSLAKIYQANGRFASAEQSFKDAMALGDDSTAVIISLALIQTAQGKPDTARALLNRHQNTLPASDYGLAMALAGDSEIGVSTLVNLIRDGQNTPVVRQNLAMAYALNGRWREAKIMADQDLSPAESDDRIRQWAIMSQPESWQQRVSSLIGVSPAQDPGLPVQLALGNVTSPSMPNSNSNAVKIAAIDYGDDELPAIEDQQQPGKQIAQAARIARAINVQNPPVAMPAANSMPVAGSAITGAFSESKYVYNPIIQPLPANYRSQQSKQASAPASANAPQKREPTIEQSGKRLTSASQNAAEFTAGSWMVQLGAFSSPDGAEKGWRNYSGKYRQLGEYNRTSMRATSSGRTVYRLAVTGFDSKAEAQKLCNNIRSRGGSCLLRQASHSDVRMASR